MQVFCGHPELQNTEGVYTDVCLFPGFSNRNDEYYEGYGGSGQFFDIGIEGKEAVEGFRGMRNLCARVKIPAVAYPIQRCVLMYTPRLSE